MSGWDLTLVDLRGHSVAGVETCVGPFGLAGTSSAVSGSIILWYCWMSGSSISMTWGGGLALTYPLLGARHFLMVPYMEYLTVLTIFQCPLLVFLLLLHLNWHPLLRFIRLQWDGDACLWRWFFWFDHRLMCWRKQSLCLAWESSPSYSGRFYCLSSMSWTCIRLGYSYWDQGQSPPCLWELGCCVNSPTHSPGSTVLSVYGYVFWSLRYLLTWCSWGWYCLRLIPS